MCLSRHGPSIRSHNTISMHILLKRTFTYTFSLYLANLRIGEVTRSCIFSFILGTSQALFLIILSAKLKLDHCLTSPRPGTHLGSIICCRKRSLKPKRLGQEALASTSKCRKSQDILHIKKADLKP